MAHVRMWRESGYFIIVRSGFGASVGIIRVFRVITCVNRAIGATSRLNGSEATCVQSWCELITPHHNNHFVIIITTMLKILISKKMIDQLKIYPNKNSMVQDVKSEDDGLFYLRELLVLYFYSG